MYIDEKRLQGHLTSLKCRAESSVNQPKVEILKINKTERNLKQFGYNDRLEVSIIFKDVMMMLLQFYISFLFF